MDIENNLNQTPTGLELSSPMRVPPVVRADAPYIDVYMAYASGCLPEVHPDYHVLIALVIQASLIGHKVKTSTNLRTNIAGLIVTVSGVGKSKATQVGIDLLKELVIQEVVEDTPLIATHATVEGLLEALQDKPSGLIDLDEFGGFLKDCQRDHMTSARENFCRALDCRQIRYMRARGKHVIVEEPCPSILGTVNMGPLRKVSSIEDLIGGLFSRFLIVAPDFQFLLPQPQPGDPELRRRLIDTMRKWKELPTQIVDVSPSLQAKIRAYAYSVCPYKEGEQIDLMAIAENENAAFIRYGTHVLKVALLLAAGEHGVGLAVELREEHVDRAIGIIDRFRGYAARVFDHLSDAEDTHLVKRVTAIMEGKRRMSFSALHQKIGGRTKSADLQEAVRHLTEQGFLKPGMKSGELLWSPRN